MKKKVLIATGLILICAVGVIAFQTASAKNVNGESAASNAADIVSTVQEVATTDYSDSLTSVAEDDSDVSDSASTEVSATAQTGVSASVKASVKAFKKYTRYTNKACNVRAKASKDSDLVGTLKINSKVTVTGISGDWSQIDYAGIKAYVKTSLLSKSKVVVEKPSGGTTSGTSTQTGGASQSDSQPASNPNVHKDPDLSKYGDDANKTIGDTNGTGTTGSDGGGYGGVY